MIYPDDLDHAAKQVVHSKNRAFERYGVDISDRSLRAMIYNIESGNAEFMSCQRQGEKTYWAVPYLGDWCYVVYDPVTRNIATFLPLNHDVVQEWLNRKRIYGLQEKYKRFSITEEEEKIASVFRHGAGTIDLETSEFPFEYWNVPFRGKTYKLKVHKPTREVKEVMEI